MSEFNAILAIAYRDLLKFLRDPIRVLSSLVFPLILIITLGGSLQANLGPGSGYNFLTFIFTGVFAQTLFQSAALGLVSLIDDRENDFSQEIFVSPISRYSIVMGKITGEALVALTQGGAIILLGLVAGVSLSPGQVINLVVVGVAVCLLGGAFGVIILSNLSSRRAAEQVFTFVFLPQFFLAGVFTPVKVLPFYLDILSRIAPLRYAVDLTRAVFYTGQPEYGLVVLQGLWFNLVVIGLMFAVFLVAGTFLFVRSERNR